MGVVKILQLRCGKSTFYTLTRSVERKGLCECACDASVCVRQRVERLTENTNLLGRCVCKPLFFYAVPVEVQKWIVTMHGGGIKSHHVSKFFFMNSIFLPFMGANRSQSTCHEANFCLFLYSVTYFPPKLKVHLLSSFYLHPTMEHALYLTSLSWSLFHIDTYSTEAEVRIHDTTEGLFQLTVSQTFFAFISVVYRAQLKA